MGTIKIDHEGINSPGLPVGDSKTVTNKYSARSLLRYPGGKTRAVDFITKFFPQRLDRLLSPFFGGGSIELAVAASGTKVYGYDVLIMKG